MAIDYVKIELDEDALAQMSDSDKLRFLVKIGFANYKTLKSHSDILFGNGKAGLKSELSHAFLNIKGLWAVILIIVGVLVKIAIG